MKTCVKAIEYYLPERTEGLDTLKSDNPEWDTDKILTKTGVNRRHIAGPQESVIDMAYRACQKLLESRNKEEIDLLILITQSPDYVLPTSACVLQDRLKLPTSTLALDVNLGCSGYVYGLALASSLIESGLAKNGLIVCSENYTKYIDRADRTCRPLFSDGAAATLISSAANDGLGPFDLGSDGSGFSNLIVPSKPMEVGTKSLLPNKLFMDGAKVFMFTMDTVPRSISAVCQKAGLNPQDIDCFVFHQASNFVIENIIRRLDLPPEKVFLNLHKIGNTVSASIPIALKDAVAELNLPKGSKVLLAGFGVGLSWGSCLLTLEGEL